MQHLDSAVLFAKKKVWIQANDLKVKGTPLKNDILVTNITMIL